MNRGLGAHCNAALALVSPRTNKNLDNANYSRDKPGEQESGELGKTDIHDAVELSIAASEALVIHELVKSELEAASILEAALRMSKARQEGVCCTIDYPSEEVDQSDSLSDFDDLIMLEAFQDVGFFCSAHECEPIYHAEVCIGKDFAEIENCNDGCGSGDKSADVLAQDNYGKSSSSTMVSSSRGINHHAFHEVSEEISQFTPPKKENTAFLEEMRHGVGKGITVKPLIRETSFLTESEDAIPDECSLVQKHKTSCTLASQSSVHFDGFCHRADALASDLLDVVSSDLSLVDPLCSVVPCSISLENEIPFLGPDKNMIGTTIIETCFGSIAGHCEELKEVESFEKDGEAVPPVVSGCPQPSVQRKSVLMRNYSTFTCTERENLPSLLPMEPLSLHPPARENNENQKSQEKTTELLVERETLVGLRSHRSLLKVPSECEVLFDTEVQVRKRVRFSNTEVRLEQEEVTHKRQDSERSKRTKYSSAHGFHNLVKEKHLASRRRYQKSLVFQGMKFLLTGFSNRKEKEIEQLIYKYGGVVLWDIPSPHSASRERRQSKSSFHLLPIILCSKKLQTTKFLYGRAVNTFILKPKWLTDSISAGSTMPPEKYMVLPNQPKIMSTKSGKPFCCSDLNRIFDGVGFMLCGQRWFCTQFAIIIKHGGGHIFRSLHSLVQSIDAEKICVGTIVSDDESRMSRHLRQCALEREIPVMPASWMVKSLYLGRLLLAVENKHPCSSKPMVQPLLPSPGRSKEI